MFTIAYSATSTVAVGDFKKVGEVLVVSLVASSYGAVRPEIALGVR